MDVELEEQVILERVELIARLTTEGFCKERDREIALSLIADITSNKLSISQRFSIIYSGSIDKNING